VTAMAASVGLLVFTAGLASALRADASTISAASCSNASVQNAINVAVTGDTVLVPAGNCTWSSTVSWRGRGITLQGAGIGQTNITDQGAGGAALDIEDTSAAAFVTVFGFTFIKSANHPNGIIQIAGSQATLGFRFHHNRILQASSGSRGMGITTVYGLIDHVTFDVTASGGSIQSVSIWGSSSGTDGGFTPWSRPLTLGTNKAVYVEDCTFTYSSQDEDSIDAYGGARLVVRRSTFNNITIGFHGTDSGDQRSAFSYEIYDNTFINNSPTTLRAATLRGGTGVIFNNTYGGTHGTWYGVTMMNYRSCPGLSYGAWGTCDGTDWEIGSTDLSAQASRISSTNGGVKFCSVARDTLCTTDATCTAINGGTCSTFFDGSAANGYACRDQIGRTHDQVLAPLYVWNNGKSAEPNDSGLTCGSGINTYITSGRDYYNNTQKPGYVAYTYPHPAGTGGVALSSPTNLRIIR
jgi:hypothetical protein